MTSQYELNDPNLMEATVASKLWGYEESYVRGILNKYPDRMPEGEYRKFGKVLVISSKGMEILTGKSMKWVYVKQVGDLMIDLKEFDEYSSAVEVLEAAAPEWKDKLGYLDPLKKKWGIRILDTKTTIYIENKIV
jgi:hypothetical protein